MNNAGKRFFGWLSTFLTLLTLAITVTINFRPLYILDIHWLDIPSLTGLTPTVLLKNFRILMNYLNFPWVKELATPDFPMSVSGMGHFVDVKQLFLLNYAVLLLTIIPTIYFLHQVKKTGQSWRLRSIFTKATFVPLVFGFLMLIGFDQFFTKFHELFFTNDDWLFDPATDPIINALPEDFFMHCFILAFVLFEVFLFIGIIWGKKDQARLRKTMKE